MYIVLLVLTITR